MMQEDKSTNTNSTHNNSTGNLRTIAVPVTIEQPIFSPYIDENVNNHIKTIIYSRARIVKFLTIIDIVFLFINLGINISTNSNLWFPILFLPFCLSGYYGSTRYKKYYLSAYNFYLCLMSIFYFTLTFYFANFLFLLIFGIEFYFFIYSTRLFYFMNFASQDIIDSLRNGWSPTEIITYYY